VATAAALSVRVSANVGDLQKGMQSAKAAVDDFGKGVDTVSTKAVAIGAAIGTVVANLAIGLAKVSFRAVVDGIGEAIEQSTRFNTALIGLSTVAAGFGHNVNQVTAAARMLSSDGLMTISESANGLKNLLATGFSLPQAIDLMNTFRDSAAFNRQGMLGFGEAVVRATEGIKFGNSALTDSTGLGKNLSAIMRDAGLSIDSAGRASQDAGVRQAIYNGFLKEGAVFAGDAAKMSMTYAGATQRLGATWDSFLATIGDAIVQNRSVAEVMNFLADVLVGLSDVLHGNGAAFTFVSDALIVMVKMMSGAVKAIDFLYRAFLSLENIVNSVVATFATGVKKIADMLLAVVAVGSQLPGGTAALGLIKDQVATLAALSAGSGKIADDANRRIEENEASSKAWGSALGGVAQKLDVLAAKLTLTRGMAVEIGVGGRRLAPQTGGGRGGGSSRVSEAQKAALEWQKAAAAWQKVYASLPKVQSGLPAGIGLPEHGSCRVEHCRHWRVTSPPNGPRTAGVLRASLWVHEGLRREPVTNHHVRADGWRRSWQVSRRVPRWRVARAVGREAVQFPRRHVGRDRREHLRAAGIDAGIDAGRAGQQDRRGALQAVRSRG
jgi:hypothetical protein